VRAKTLVLIGLALAAFMLAPLILAAPGADAARRASVAQTPRRQRSAQVGVVPPTPDQYAYSSGYPLVLHPLRSARETQAAPSGQWAGREDLVHAGNAQARRLGLSVGSPSACAAAYRQLLRYSSRSRISAADSAASRLNSRRTMTPVSS